MPAKLDTTKPLRLIGIQIFQETMREVRKSLNPGWYPFIQCDNSDELETSRDQYPIVSKLVCPQDYYKIDDNLPKISISAIVGKNGSGKSTLIDILYRIINNFAENTFLLKGVDKTNDIGHAYGIHGRLHFEQDGVQKFIECNDLGTFYYEVVDGKAEEVKIHGLTEKQRYNILNGFFYTISVNYSLYAFNPSDYSKPFADSGKELNDGHWLSYLFHKNDGYYIPLVLTPFREDGQIDINNENELAKQRIEVLSLMFHSQKKEFLDDYVPKKIKYRFLNDYCDKKSKSLLEKPIKRELKNVQNILISQFAQIWENVLSEKLKRKFNRAKSDRDTNVIFYLAYKTLKICSTYPKYLELSNLNDLFVIRKLKASEKSGKSIKNSEGSEVLLVDTNDATLWVSNNYNNMFKVVETMYNSPCNHITLKVHQCLDYLKDGRYQAEEDELDVDKDLLKGQSVETYDDMMRMLPPPFFITEVTFIRKIKRGEKKEESEVTLQSMSSGERQMLYSLSYVYYHIKNIASIKGGDGKRVVGYHHINLIFDEAELYYHPEYQRQYVKRLLERLALCHINHSSIRSINIIIITHSPFILSDLPQSNVLFLPKDTEKDVPKLTLGANIYDLLKNGFFLDYAIGDLVQMKLQEILNLYYENNKDKQSKLFKARKAEISYTIRNLGDKYLLNSFNSIYEQLMMQMPGKTKNDVISELKDYHQKEVERLTKIQEEK